MNVEVEFINADITVEFTDTIVAPEVTGDEITVEFTDTGSVVEFTGSDVTVETTTTTTEVTVETTDVTVEMPQHITYDLTGVDLSLLKAGFPSTSFIFNSSGGQTGTRYNDWADLMAAIDLIDYGGPRNIVFEQNESSAIPVGSYDLTDVTLLGNGFGILEGGLVVEFQEGVELTNDILRVGGGLNLRYAGTAGNYLMDASDGSSKAIYLSDLASVVATGGGAFIYALGGTSASCSLVAVDGNTNIFVGNGGFGIGNGYIIYADTTSQAQPIVMVDNAGGTIWMDDMVYVSNAANNANMSYYIYSASGPINDYFLFGAVFLPDQTNAGPGSLFTITTAITTTPVHIAYYPTTSGDWSGDPVTVQEALDRMAAAIADLRDGTVTPPVARPIP